MVGRQQKWHSRGDMMSPILAFSFWSMNSIVDGIIFGCKVANELELDLYHTGFCRFSPMRGSKIEQHHHPRPFIERNFSRDYL